MLDAIRAEALKLRYHRATWFMIWIFPILIGLLVSGFVIYHAVAGPGAPGAGKTAEQWIASSALLWRFPGSGPGRFLIAGYAALAFAGEYGWNTWKLVIPARVRWQLVVAKWVTVLLFLFAALIAADLIGLAGDWIGTWQGDPLPAGVTVSAILDAHVRAAGHALLPIAFTVALAALFAVLTQSILAATILSIAIVVIEGLLPLIGFVAYARAPGLTVALIEGLPLYHLANLAAWAKGTGLSLPLAADRVVALSWGTSLAVVGAWTAALGAATLVRFGRQDIN